jgi:hypothetical protein
MFPSFIDLLHRSTGSSENQKVGTVVVGGWPALNLSGRLTTEELEDQVEAAEYLLRTLVSYGLILGYNLI